MGRRWTDERIINELTRDVSAFKAIAVVRDDLQARVVELESKLERALAERDVARMSVKSLLPNSQLQEHIDAMNKVLVVMQKYTEGEDDNKVELEPVRETIVAALRYAYRSSIPERDLDAALAAMGGGDGD